MRKRGQHVTPWEVSHSVDYEKLIMEFGTQRVGGNLLKNQKKLHPLLRRGLFFSHRDFNLWLKDAESGKKVSILTGRGPSEKMHIGHLVPLLLAKSFQEIYKCNVYLPISEDEKFFVKKNLSFRDAEKFASDNILDLIALGFKKNRTFIIRDFGYPEVYRQSSRIAKLITYSEAKAIFGLAGENNVGWSFYPAVQAYHILLPQFTEGPHRTLVPVGIDQDPFIRLTRDIAGHSSIGFEKPSGIYSKFLPSLKGSAKMSSSEEENSLIYLSDSPEEVRKKINKYAFSGGKDTLKEHRKHGGNPDADVSFQYLKFFFEPDDKKLRKIEKDYKSGKLLSGELKAMLTGKINSFLREHRKARQRAEKEIDKFMLKA